MQEVPFQNDGPVCVSTADFQTFLNFCHSNPSFDELYYHWIDEKHSDDFRRLCLRTLLRQSYGNAPEDKRPLYYTREGLGRIFCIGGGNDKTSVLYWELYNRPKLKGELVYEFLYALNHQRIFYCNKDSLMDDACRKLITLLIPMVTAKIGKELWKFYPHSALRNDDVPLWLPSKNMPNWLRQELEEQLRIDLRNEGMAIVTKMTERNLKALSAYYYHETLIAQDFPTTCTVITHARRYGNNNQLCDAEACLQLLEDTMPLSIEYIPDTYDLFKILPRINNEDLILQVARRHLLSFANITKHPERQEFKSRQAYRLLCWVHFLVKELRPDDKQFLAAIKALQKYNRTKDKA